jgi:putative nucleotidyltransferase with HDIG domain
MHNIIKQMTKKELNIFTILSKNSKCYIVGGAIRDYFLKIKCNDFDLCTNLHPFKVKSLFKQHNISAKILYTSFKGKQTLTGICLVDGIEIATFRGDTYGGNGQTDVDITFVDTIEEDLSRRDFTMNAMALTINGRLIDPFNGIKDIKNKEIKFVGNPTIRIKEDPNRILRLFRFSCALNFTINLHAIKAVQFNNKIVQIIKKERIRLEILKVMKCKNASKFFYLLNISNCMKFVFPEFINCFGHPHGDYHTENVLEHNMYVGDAISTKFPLLKLAGYLHDIGKPISYNKLEKSFHNHQNIGAGIVEKRLKNLKFSSIEISYIKNLVLIHMDGTKNMSNKARRKLQVKLHKKNISWRDYVRLRIADRTGNKSRKKFTINEIKQYIRLFTTKEEIPFNVNNLQLKGGEIINIFNLTPGKLIGEIQRYLFKLVINNEILNTKQELINSVNTYLTR